MVSGRTRCNERIAADPLPSHTSSWGQEITASITPRESRAVHQQKFSAGRVNHRDSVRVYNQRHGHGSVGGKVKAILKDPMAGLADLQMNHGLD